MKRTTLACIWWFALVALLFAQSQKRTESFWAKLLRIAGVSTTPASLRGDDHVTSGDIWWVTVSEKVPQRLTRDGGYYSPIFEAQGQNVLALRGKELYRVPLSGDSPARLHTLPSVTKLVGLSRDDPDEALVVGEDPQQHRPFAALVSIRAGTLIQIPHNARSTDDQVMLAHLEGWERVYGDTRLYTEKNEKQGPGGTTIEFSDIYLKQGSAPPLNLTHGTRVSSTQPSLSPDGHKIAFIRGER